MIHVPTDRLPADPAERSRRLQAYFGDLIPTATATGEGWSIELRRSQLADFYVDPVLEQGLAWWGPGGSVGDIHRLVRREREFQLSLDDSWTLYDWSLWLAERRRRGEAPEGVTILHVDDHTDFMTPRVARDGTSWSDLITGHPCDLLAPETVQASILSGAVGIGSFMAPLLHHVPRCEFRHLSQSVNRRTPDPVRCIALPIEEDTLLRPGALRPGVSLEPWDADQRGGAFHRYVVTHRPDEWVEALPEWPILLHIDMDYFNNRFDRDSDWHLSADLRHDPCLASMSGTLDALFLALNRAGVTRRIESAAVALSPGFFPAEFWQPLTERLAAWLRGQIQSGDGGGPP